MVISMNYIDIALDPTRILNHLSIIKNKCALVESGNFKDEMLHKAGHIELQLTDRCQLNCANCHFRGLGDYDFNIDWLENIIKYIKPKAVTFAGGGEPTVYKHFNDVVVKLGKNPEIQMGLITNGVFIPDGRWHKKISWIRISVYSVINNKYAGRSAKLIKKVLANIKWYLSYTDVPNIGVHFLFYKENIDECVNFAKRIYEVFREYTYNRLHIQFKPAFVIARPTILTQNLHKENIRLLPTHDQIEKVISNFQIEADNNRSFKEFLENRSNYVIFKKLHNSYLKKLVNITNPSTMDYKKFKYCYVCLAFQLIAPDGIIYPCLTLAEYRHEKFSLCHISDLSKSFNGRLYDFYQANTECCNDVFCRNYNQNQIVKNALIKNKNTTISEDMFF
ncbi:radical SAM protein [Candidatus Magnetomorum sp. HK-1]|nr:radical SAM protein [Candidatus Magnetomorum sp. HK-1]